MTDTRKINFTCPECGSKELYAHRHEIINHPLRDEIDIEQELYINDIAYDKDYIEDSMIISIICSGCGYEIVPEGWKKRYSDPAEPLIEWLEEHSMLPVVKTFYCKFCGTVKGTPEGWHQEEPVCNQCWDERLRCTE
jgi:hypothetical protein